MNRKVKRVKTLLGLFQPEYWPEIRERIKACKLIDEPLRAASPDSLADIRFVFVKRGDKTAVYREFVHALNRGMLRYKLGVVITYLAEHATEQGFEAVTLDGIPGYYAVIRKPDEVRTLGLQMAYAARGIKPDEKS